jgi:hypothetical protein
VAEVAERVADGEEEVVVAVEEEVEVAAVAAAGPRRADTGPGRSP